MVDFLKIDLNNYAQPADVRLKDELSSGDIIVTQAHFNVDGANIVRLRSDEKAKEFHLDANEADAFCDAWMDYRGRVIQHATDKEVRVQTAIAEAKALASSVHFDYEPLNIKLARDNSDASWSVEIPAISFNRWVYERKIHDLVPVVQEALTTLKDRVAYAEKENWPATHRKWNAIVTSYRRVFPLPNPANPFNAMPSTEQGEPAEIAQARALLKEALHPTEWAQSSIYPGTNNTWSFDNGMEGDAHYHSIDTTAAYMLDIIQEYLERKQSNTMKQGELACQN